MVRRGLETSHQSDMLCLTLEHLLRFSAVRYHKTSVHSHCVHTALDILSSSLNNYRPMTYSRLRTNIHTQYIHSYFYLLKQVEDYINADMGCCAPAI